MGFVKAVNKPVKVWYAHCKVPWCMRAVIHFAIQEIIQKRSACDWVAVAYANNQRETGKNVQPDEQS